MDSAYSWCYTILCRFCIISILVIIFAAYYFFGPSYSSLVQAIIFCINWGPFIIKCFFALVAAIVGTILFYNKYWIPTKRAKAKAKLYDEYVAKRPLPESNNYRVTEVEDDYNNNNNINNSSYYKDVAPAFEDVKECNYYGEQEVEEVKSMSYRMTRTERKMVKKGMRMMEYQRTESERVSKTASWRSKTMDGSSCEVGQCFTVERCITDNKKVRFWQSDNVDQWQHGDFGPWRNSGQNVHWQNNVPQFQNGGVDPRENGVVQWLMAAPQLQNGWQNGAPQWQYGMVPWTHDDGSGHHHESGSQRLVDGSGSNGYYGPYLGISY